jgi:hypothetical protein
LIGIAIERGFLTGVDMPVVEVLSLSAIVSEVTGMPASEFAEEVLRALEYHRLCLARRPSGGSATAGET